jgi:hypothetical protein
VDYSSSGKRVFVSEINPNITWDNVSNSSFTPKGFFIPDTSYQVIYSFGISFDGSYSYLGGNHPYPK